MLIFFYLFAFYITLSSAMVIVSKNPVYSVIWLIFAFCNGAGLMILLGAEFIAMMLIIIYVGAIAVLFLFVVMMLNINFAEIRGEFRRNISLNALIGLIMLTDLVVIILLSTKNTKINIANNLAIPENIGNVYSIGRVLYTDFILPFQCSGIVLFIAMIACISLTLRFRPGVKKQNPTEQLLRNKHNATKQLSPKIGSGVEGIDYDN